MIKSYLGSFAVLFFLSSFHQEFAKAGPSEKGETRLIAQTTSTNKQDSKAVEFKPVETEKSALEKFNAKFVNTPFEVCDSAISPGACKTRCAKKQGVSGACQEYSTENLKKADAACYSNYGPGKMGTACVPCNCYGPKPVTDKKEE